MTVYVESNFVLQLALDQEQAGDARTILKLAEDRLVPLAIPAFALSEPFAAVRRRTSDRNKLIDLLKQQRGDLRRSRHHREIVRSIDESRSVLEGIERHETDELISVIRRLMRVAIALPLGLDDLLNATEYQTRYDFKKIQDALIYSTIVRNLTEVAARGPHYFVTTDKSDFDHPGIVTELTSLECEILFSFGEALLRLEQPLPD